MRPGVHLTSAPSPSTAPESARLAARSTAPTASSVAGTRSNLNSQENAFSGQSATNAASHGAYAVRVAQIAADRRELERGPSAVRSRCASSRRRPTPRTRRAAPPQRELRARVTPRTSRCPATGRRRRVLVPDHVECEVAPESASHAAITSEHRGEPKPVLLVPRVEQRRAGDHALEHQPGDPSPCGRPPRRRRRGARRVEHQCGSSR